MFKLAVTSLRHLYPMSPQGRRPVTLVGFSLGARVIYFCLQEMAQEQGKFTCCRKQKKKTKTLLKLVPSTLVLGSSNEPF